MLVVGPPLFKPYRVLGLVTDNVRPAFQHRATSFYVTTSIGHSFHIYDLDKLNTLFIGSLCEGKKITALTCHQDLTIVGLDGEIIICERAKEIMKIELPTNHKVLQLEAIGNLLLVLQSNSTLVFLSNGFLDLMDHLQVVSVQEEESREEYATCFVHPYTYLNKLLIGTSTGVLYLWNIKTKKLIYTFKDYHHHSPITTLQQSPALDIIAIGFEDGVVALHHLKEDVCVVKLRQKGSVTSLSFRTDGPGHLASGNRNGDIVIWNLDERKHLLSIPKSHEKEIISLYYLPNQPILFSAGHDNSMKEWIFEGPDMSPRLLKSRAGHSEPLTRIQYYDKEGHFILSASIDKSFRQFSVFKDSQHCELSQGHVHRHAKEKHLPVETFKLPSITEIASCLTRRKDWDNIVTAHQDSNRAQTWSMETLRIGQYSLKSKDDSNITATLISPCGNFVLLGCQSGSIDVFNIQSGRFQFCLVPAHSKAVTGLALNSGNRTLVSVSLDGQLIFWDYPKKTLKETVQSNQAICRLAFHLESDLIAFPTEDCKVHVYDMDTLNQVRLFVGHSQAITELCFSENCKWLLSSALDKTVRTWDLSTGHCIDVLCLDRVPSSITLSPAGDFLAVAKADSIGIHMYANISYYHALPNLGNAEDDETFFQRDIWKKASSTDTFVLSSAQTIHWQNLLHLDLIKERNKPIEPPKAPEKVPFFMSFSSSKEKKPVPKNSMDHNGVQQKESKIIKDSGMSFYSDTVLKLLEADESHKFVEFHEYFKTLSPSNIDLEIRILSSLEAIEAFLNYLQSQLLAKNDFDLIQTYLNLFLKTHADEIEMYESIIEKVKNLSELVDEQWRSLESYFQQSLCFTDYTKSKF